MDDAGKIKELRKICDSIQVDRKALKDYSSRKGISSMDVDRFIREGAFVDDGAGRIITNEDYKTSDSPGQPTSKPEPEPESEPETEENDDVEPETKPIRQPSKTIDEILAEDFGENISPEVNTKAKTLLEDYLKANPTDHIPINAVRATVYLASNLLGYSLSQGKITKQTGASPAKLSGHIKDLAKFHNINVPFKVPQGNLPKTEAQKPSIQLEQSSPKIGYNDMAAAASLLDLTTNDALRQFSDLIYINADVPLPELDRTTAQFVDFVTKKGGVERAAERGNAKLIMQYLPVLQKKIIEHATKHNIDNTTEEIHTRYAPIMIKGVEIPSSALEKLGTNQRDLLTLIGAGKDRSAICEAMYYSVKGFRHAIYLLDKRLTQINVKVDLSIDGESLNKVSTLKEERGDIDMAKEDSQFNYADIASAAKEAGINGKDKTALRNFAMQIYENAGSNHKAAYMQSYNFLTRLNQKGTLAKLATDGNIDNIKKYLPSEETIDDKVDGKEKAAKSKAGAVDTKTEAPKPKKGSFFTYGDVALAIKENHIKEDDWLDFATAAYKNTGLNKQKSKSRAYAFKNYVKGDGEGLANVAKTGSLERIQKYLSKASQESVEDKTEETNEQDEARTPATTVKPFEAESLTDEQHILVTNITNDISRSLEFVLNMDLQPKDLSYINTKSKSFAQDIYAIGKTYVAQEETRVAGLKKRLEDFKTENNIPG